jgi:TolA-binding protein
MLSQELRARLSKLDAEIAVLEEEIRPLQQKLSGLQEFREHALRLLELENGGSAKTTHVTAVVPRKPGGDPHWQAIAEQHGYRVNGDSAHRVVRRRNPALHASIAHHCDYDQKSYP